MQDFATSHSRFIYNSFLYHPGTYEKLVKKTNHFIKFISEVYTKVIDIFCIVIINDNISSINFLQSAGETNNIMISLPQDIYKNFSLLCANCIFIVELVKQTEID